MKILGNISLDFDFGVPSLLPQSIFFKVICKFSFNLD